MSDKRTIWEHPIIAGVSVTAIVGLATWIFPSVRAVSKSVLAFVLGLLGTPIPLWVSLLALVLFVAAISIKRRIDRRLDGPQRLQEQTSTAELVDRITQRVQESPEPELDDVQTKIMHLFANLDGGRLTRGDISQTLRVSTLLADRALEQLENIALITDDQKYLYGTVFVLTIKGRDFVLDRGWVG